ncbi:Phosphatidylinositol 3-kinase [Entamoeba marina]
MTFVLPDIPIPFRNEKQPKARDCLRVLKYDDYTFGELSQPIDLPFTVKIHLPEPLKQQLGKSYVDIAINKSATVDELLQSFFDIFGTGVIEFRNILLEDNYSGLVLLSCLKDGEDLVDLIFQFIKINGIEADYISTFASVHGTNNALLRGLLASLLFEKEKTFLDTLFMPMRSRIQNGMFEVDSTKCKPNENIEQNIGYLCNLVKQLRSTLFTGLVKVSGETVYIFYMIQQEFNELDVNYSFSKFFFLILLTVLKNGRYPRANVDWKYATYSQETNRMIELLNDLFAFFIDDIKPSNIPDIVLRTFNNEIITMAEGISKFFKGLRPLLKSTNIIEKNESIERTVLAKLLTISKNIFQTPCDCSEFVKAYPMVPIPLIQQRTLAIQNVSSNYHLRVPSSMYYIKVSQVQMTPIGEWEYVKQRTREFLPIEFECVDSQTFEQDKIVLFHISVIISISMKWDCTNPEEFYFRRCSYNSAFNMKIPFIPISSNITSIPYPQSFPETLFVKLWITPDVCEFCGLSKRMSALQVNYQNKPSMIIDKFLRSIQHARADFEVGNNMFYLKTIGFDEYLFEDEAIGNYLYIREMLRYSKPIQLLLVLEAGDFEQKLLTRQKSEELERNWKFNPLPVDLPVIDVIKSHSKVNNKMGVFLEQVVATTDIFYTNSLYVVLAEIYFGGEILWSSKTPLIMQSSNETTKYNTITLDSWIIFRDCEVKNLPKESILVLKVCEYDKDQKRKTVSKQTDVCPYCKELFYKGKEKDKDKQNRFCSCNCSDHLTLISWTDLYLFDYRNLLVSGTHKLYLVNPPVIPVGIPVTEFGNIDSFTGTIKFSFPKGPTILFHLEENIQTNKQISITTDDITNVEKIILTTNLYHILHQDKLHSHPSSILRLGQSVNWKNPAHVVEFESMIQNWPLVPHIIAMRLLHFSFANNATRKYAVDCLAQCSDENLATIMMQLIQSLKFEASPSSDLAVFLIHRALNKRSTIGRIFFWLMKSELHIPETQRRFALLLEAYLLSCGDQRIAIKDQLELCNKLSSLYTQNNQAWKTDTSSLIKELNSIPFPKTLFVPYKQSLRCKQFLANECKVLDSLRKPLFLTFQNEDPDGDNVYIIFKKDDDLRQDMFALKVLEAMNQMWQSEGFDMRLSLYECLAMGKAVGMIEVVLGSETIAAIQKMYGGGNVSAAFQEKPLYRWLREKNPGKDDFNNAQQNFIYSCAGYCVATYVLGVGDRHNDNILLTKTGHLAHIDFGHILGNVEKFKGIKRETAPFVLTKEFVYVMGGKNSDGFKLFVNLCCETFLILRRNSHGLLNLFMMMLSTGMPELRKTEDVSYLLNSLVLDLSEKDARSYFEKLINVALEAVMTRVNNAIHIFAHPEVKENM